MKNKHRISRITALEVRRRELGKGQKEMASALGISISTFSDFEHGRFTPRVRDVKHYAEAYNWTMFELMNAIHESSEAQ